MTNLTKKTIGEGLAAISVNFGLELKPEYIILVFNQLKDKLDDNEFLMAVNKILNSQETFYNKMPRIATFLKYAEKQQLTIEQQAKIEVEHIIEHAKGYISGQIIFDNPTTNAVARDYEKGISYINNHLTNNWLDYRKSEATIRKELLEKWLIYQHDKIESNSIIKIDESNNFTMIGDKIKCKAILHKNSKLIEQTEQTKNQKKINLLIAKMANKNV
jgi:hypothetical protein